jgi:hypothetical protein
MTQNTECDANSYHIILTSVHFIQNSLLHYRHRVDEPFVAGDVIFYYNSILVTGDPRGHRTATVLEVDPEKDLL